MSITQAPSPRDYLTPTADYKAYYFPDRDAQGVKGEVAADAEFEQMNFQPQLQDANVDSTDADALNESSRAGNPATAEPGGIRPRHLDVLEPGGYNIPGLNGDEGRPQHTSNMTPAERLAYYRPDQGQWAPTPRKGQLGTDTNTQIKDDADVDADDDLHKALDMDSATSRRAGLGAKARGMDEDEDAEGENEFELGTGGYTITGVEDEGEQLNS
ncbi:hypothetical protein BDV11DRAFT_208187 [Aspergillus similis]